MGKALLFLVGLAAGAAGATAWILGEVPGASIVGGNPEFESRVQDVRQRVQDALAQGEKAGEDTQQRLRAELSRYRQGKGA